MLENRDQFSPETKAAIERLKSDLLREHFPNDTVKAQPENSGLDSHDRAVGILEMHREKIIKELAQEIRRISWLDENELENASAVKRIAEIGQDLRSGAIKKMLVEKYKVIPGTKAADEKMSQLYEIWARQWMEALEVEKKPKKSVDIAEAVPLSASETEEVNKSSGYEWPEEERDPVKATALHTFVNLPIFEDVNADTAEEGGKKVNEMAKKVWGNPTVHGFLDLEHPDPETGEPGIARRTDLDGRGYLAILKKAGLNFDMKDVGYVKQGDLPKLGRGLVGDTGNEDGVVAKNFGELLVSDHHGEKSGRNTSATRNKYEALVASGNIERSAALEAFIEFVTKEDNKDYTDEECRQIMENFETSLFGLQRYMSGEQVIEIFEKLDDSGNKFSPYEKLPEKYLSEIDFQMSNGAPIKTPKTSETPKTAERKYVVERLLNIRKRVEREVKKMARDGFVFETDRYGKILLDTGTKNGDKSRKKKLQGGIEIIAGRSAGFGGLVVWNPEANSFSIQVANEDIDFSLPEGKNYRGRYWLKIPGEEKMRTTLEDILGKLSGQENYQIDDNLKLALKGEKIGVKKELLAKQKSLLEELSKKVPFQEIKDNLSKGFSADLSEGEKSGRRGNREASLLDVKRALKNIAMNFSEEDVAFFRDSFMDQILAYYRAEKEKVKRIDKIRELRTKTINNIKDIAAKNGFKEEHIRFITDYFGSLFSIEFLANNSKNNQK